jgi:hypothetical protein
MVKAVQDAGVSVEIAPDHTVRITAARRDLPTGGQARNANGYVDARLADAPWARSN